MAFISDSRGSSWVNDRLPGPAGTVTAAIAPRLNAEMDVAAGFLVSLAHTALSISPERQQLLRDVVENIDSHEAVRQLVFATVFALDEPEGEAKWWLLDRLLARLDLAEVIPALKLSPDDPDVRAAIDFLLSSPLVSEERLLRTQVVIDSLGHLRPDSGLVTTAMQVERHELDGALLGRHRGAPDRHIATGVNLVILSAGPDLAHARTRQPATLTIDRELEITIAIPVVDPGSWGGRFACYLVQPGHDHPVAQIAVLQPDGAGSSALVGRFRARDNSGFDGYEFVVLPTWSDPSITSRTAARTLLAAEIGVRTAVRLAHKGQTQQALARLADAETLLRNRRDVPGYFFDRLHALRDEIEFCRLPDRFLGDL